MSGADLKAGRVSDGREAGVAEPPRVTGAVTGAADVVELDGVGGGEEDAGGHAGEEGEVEGELEVKQLQGNGAQRTAQPQGDTRHIAQRTVFVNLLF